VCLVANAPLPRFDETFLRQCIEQLQRHDTVQSVLCALDCYYLPHQQRSGLEAPRHFSVAQITTWWCRQFVTNINTHIDYRFFSIAHKYLRAAVTILDVVPASEARAYATKVVTAARAILCRPSADADHSDDGDYAQPAHKPAVEVQLSATEMAQAHELTAAAENTFTKIKTLVKNLPTGT
ncbi:hypothetical protein RI367_006643, partial [Sorochytrium milnesiophthora]